MILFLFLSHLGVGIVFTLVFVSRDAGVKFFRFNAGLAAILIAVAFVFRPADGRRARSRDWPLWRWCVREAAIVLYWATIGRALASHPSGRFWRSRVPRAWSRSWRRPSTRRQAGPSPRRR